MGRYPPQPRRERERRRVVPRRVRRDAAPRLLVLERQHGVARPPELERADLLEALALEEHARAGDRVSTLRLVHWRPVAWRDARGRATEVVVGGGLGHAGDGTALSSPRGVSPPLARPGKARRGPTPLGPIEPTGP
jgi:hypothetical protein